MIPTGNDLKGLKEIETGDRRGPKGTEGETEGERRGKNIKKLIQ